MTFIFFFIDVKVATDIVRLAQNIYLFIEIIHFPSFSSFSQVCSISEWKNYLFMYIVIEQLIVYKQGSVFSVHFIPLTTVIISRWNNYLFTVVISKKSFSTSLYLDESKIRQNLLQMKIKE